MVEQKENDLVCDHQVSFVNKHALTYDTFLQKTVGFKNTNYTYNKLLPFCHIVMKSSFSK